MSEPYAMIFKFSKFLTKSGFAESRGSEESITLNDFNCSDLDDLGYLESRRQWTMRYTSEAQPSYGGAPSEKKNDLEICGLLHLREPNLSDKVEEVFCDTSSEISPDSCCYGLEAEENQNSVKSEQRNMESNQSKTKKNVVFKLFNRLGSFKKDNGLNNSSTDTLEEQELPREESDQRTHVKISYEPVSQPAPSRESYYATPKTSVASIDVPPDQSLLAKQHSILRRLHSTLHEATNIVGEFLVLYKPDE